MQAKFEFYPETGPAPLTVQFHGKTPGTSYFSWDFGDGSPIAGDWNARHTYQSPGTYLIRHETTTQPDGETTSAEATIVVADPLDVPLPPIADFDFICSIGHLLPVYIRFMNRSTGNISGYEWNFDDGETSQEMSPYHTFIEAGIYRVSMTATGPGGSNTVTKDIMVHMVFR